MEGAIVSAVSLDNSVVEHFSDASDINEGNEVMVTDRVKNNILKYYHAKDIFHPAIFQDDVGKLSRDIASAQDANNLST